MARRTREGKREKGKGERADAAGGMVILPFGRYHLRPRRRSHSGTDHYCRSLCPPFTFENVMGMGFFCFLVPEVPSADKFFTDGKNLARAYVSGSAGCFDSDQPSDDSTDGDAQTPQDVALSADIFSELDPFIEPTGTPQQLHPPADGLVAIANTLQRLRGAEGAVAIPNPNLRAGCIFDLETYAQILREAERHPARFALMFDL